MEWKRDDYLLTDDPSSVDTTITYNLLKDTYWGHKRSPEIVESFLRSSLNFTLFREGNQIGYARVVTDYAVFSWFADFVIEPSFRGQALGTWMMESIINHPKLSQTQFVLQTGDAHTFYEKQGFAKSDWLMSMKRDE